MRTTELQVNEDKVNNTLKISHQKYSQRNNLKNNYKLWLSYLYKV